MQIPEMRGVSTQPISSGLSVARLSIKAHTWPAMQSVSLKHSDPGASMHCPLGGGRSGIPSGLWLVNVTEVGEQICASLQSASDQQ